MVVGDPGLGKSLVLTKLAAGITTGKGIPDSQQMEPGGVIIMAPEDSNSRTIVPRLKATGADLTKVLLLSEITETDNDGKEYKRPISFPEDVGILEEAMIDAKAKLVIIDPILAMISAKQDTHKDQQIRIALGRVISLAEQYETAVMGVVHLNKNQGGNALYRSGASIALIAMARTGLFLVPDPDDEDMRVLVNHKNNLSMKAASLRFSIHQTENEIGYIKWEGVSSYSEQELLSQSTPTNNPKSQQEMDIMNILKNPEEETHPAMTIAQIRPQTKQSEDALEKMLNRKVNQGILMRPARGLYTYVGNPLYTFTEETRKSNVGNVGSVGKVSDVGSVPHSNIAAPDMSVLVNGSEAAPEETLEKPTFPTSYVMSESDVGNKNGVYKVDSQGSTSQFTPDSHETQGDQI